MIPLPSLDKRLVEKIDIADLLSSGSEDEKQYANLLSKELNSLNQADNLKLVVKKPICF